MVQPVLYYGVRIDPQQQAFVDQQISDTKALAICLRSLDRMRRMVTPAAQLRAVGRAVDDYLQQLEDCPRALSPKIYKLLREMCAAESKALPVQAPLHKVIQKVVRWDGVRLQRLNLWLNGKDPGQYPYNVLCAELEHITLTSTDSTIRERGQRMWCSVLQHAESFPQFVDNFWEGVDTPAIATDVSRLTADFGGPPAAPLMALTDPVGRIKGAFTPGRMFTGAVSPSAPPSYDAVNHPRDFEA